MSENQKLELRYTEFRLYGQVNINFRKICPYSSGTIKKQKEEKKGISLVVFFSPKKNEEIRNEIINKIYDLPYRFIPTKNLHCTFLSLSTKETFQKPNDHYIELIIEQIENFLNGETNRSMKLIFNEIRSGTWYGQDNYPIPYASDGTVVAIGKPCTAENANFVGLAFELVKYFKANLYSVFGSKFDRNFPTIWSTLGYFDHKDFDINKRFIDTFNKFKPLEVEVNKLSLIEFSYKDLRDYQILKEYEL